MLIDFDVEQCSRRMSDVFVTVLIAWNWLKLPFQDVVQNCEVR